jgi:small-conductance mechanosensitive channel
MINYNYTNLKVLIYSTEFKVILLIILGFVINVLINFILKKIFQNKLLQIPENQKGKISTIFNIFIHTKSVILWLIIFMLILSLYKVNITAILTGFGIVGAIVGLALQAIIADFFAGIALILDRFFYIGDRIKVGEIEGEVIDITLRRTYIKDDNGYIHSIPNSQLKTISKKIK